MARIMMGVTDHLRVHHGDKHTTIMVRRWLARARASCTLPHASVVPSSSLFDNKTSAGGHLNRGGSWTEKEMSNVEAGDGVDTGSDITNTDTGSNTTNTDTGSNAAYVK